MLLSGLWGFSQEGAVSWHLLNPGAESQSRWVCMSSKSVVSPLRGYSFFCCCKPHRFLQPEVMGTYLPDAEILGYAVWPGAGITGSQGIPPDFYLPHVSVGLPILHFYISVPPTHLDECDFFNSLVVRLPYS